MTSYVTGETIRRLREEKGLTQKQLGEMISVSDKAVSKWETLRGLPDIALLEPLGAALGVSVVELLSGACIRNANRAGNLKRMVFYVCPVCGNIIQAMGEGSFTCCGITLPPQTAEAPDEAHSIQIERVENDLYVRMAHPMEKTHALSFFALITADAVHLVKLYPEQDAEARFPGVVRGTLYAYCNRHGLFRVQAKG